MATSFLDQIYKTIAPGKTNFAYQEGPKPGQAGFIGPVLPGTKDVRYPNSQGDVLGVSNTAGGGGGGGGAGSNVYSGFNVNDSFEPTPQDSGIDFNALIAPALQALGDAENAAQSSYGADVSEIDANYAKQKGQQEQFVQGEETKAGQQRTSTTQQAESAVNESRRQYSEIQQGLQSLYGGTTGTGAFATELAGRQTLQNVAQLRQNLTNAITQIDDRLGQVRQVSQLALEDLENQTTAQKQQAKASLDRNLADIRGQRGALESRKAELAMSAMQQYQQLVSEVNARNSSFKQQLAQQALAAEQQLTNARSRAADIAQNYVVDLGSVEKQVTPVGLQVQSAEYIPGKGYSNVNIGRPKTGIEDDEQSLF